MTRIVSWNVNGIRAVHKKGLFLPFIKKFEPDILCLQETKAEKGQAEIDPVRSRARAKGTSPADRGAATSNGIDLPEYEEYWNSAVKKGYSGTAIFTKIKPLSVALGLPEKISKKYGFADDGYGDPNKEGRIVAAEFKDFYVVTVYTPNAKDDLSRIPLRHKQWDPAFLEYVKELEKVKPVIFCGDLNVAHTAEDLARPKANEGLKGFTVEEREGIDKIISAGFVDTFRIFTKGNGHYSWWSHFANARARNVGWRIDYIFVSSSLAKKVKSAKILPEVLGSDHCPILIEM